MSFCFSPQEASHFKYGQLQARPSRFVSPLFLVKIVMFSVNGVTMAEAEQFLSMGKSGAKKPGPPGRPQGSAGRGGWSSNMPPPLRHPVAFHQALPPLVYPSRAASQQPQQRQDPDYRNYSQQQHVAAPPRQFHPYSETVNQCTLYSFLLIAVTVSTKGGAGFPGLLEAWESFLACAHTRKESAANSSFSSTARNSSPASCRAFTGASAPRRWLCAIPRESFGALEKKSNP